jgi:3-oxoacyl-[acyl-carrier-protein] synthase II
MGKRCVVTGIGIVSPVGTGKEKFWGSLVEGKSGISEITYFDTSNLPVRYAGEVKDFEASEYIDEDRLSVTGRYVHFALGAVQMALADAGISPKNNGTIHAGLAVGTTSPPADYIENYVSNTLQNTSSPKAPPEALSSICPHSPTAEIANAFGGFETVSTISTVCTSGCNAIGASIREIRSGRKKLMIAGATESTIVLFTFLAYISAGLLVTKTDLPPQKIMRPFDKNRCGALLSEGAAFFVLEEFEHARLRGAHIYGEIAGYASRDRFRGSMRTLPVKQGMVNTMRAALDDARIPPGEIDYVCANGVSTQMLDKMETLALKEVFGDQAYRIPITATKSMLGIPNSCAGPMDLATALLAFQDNVIPPTINYENPDPNCDLDYVPNTARVNRVNTALLNNHAMDGGNAALVVRRV